MVLTDSLAGVWHPFRSKGEQECPLCCREREAAMPTVVHFVGAEEPITLLHDYDRVNIQLNTEGKAGQFDGVIGENHTRVMVYKSGIAYIEEVSPESEDAL
jgi:hypothetical protein